MDIEQKDYEALVARAGKVDELSAKVGTLEAEAAKVPDLERKVEQLEVDKKKAEDDLSAATTKITEFEEQSRVATLASERTSKLGKGFVAKLPDSIKDRLNGQAGKLSDEDWSARLDELSELVGVKPDDAGESGSESGGSGGGSSSETFSREETSRTHTGSGGGSGSGGSEPSRAAVGSVVGGVLKRLAPPAKEPAGK